MIRRCALALCLVAVAACEDPTQGTVARFDFARSALFDAPFPSDDLRDADHRIHLAGFPNPNGNKFVQQAIALIERDARGFSTAGAIYFSFTKPLGTVPTIEQTLRDGSDVFVMSVTPASADFGKRRPLEVDFKADGGPYANPNLLSLLPVQGRPLGGATTYAAVVLRSLGDATGKKLGIAPALHKIMNGTRPAAMSAAAFEAYRTALTQLEKNKVPRASIAALAVFTTDDPAGGLRAVAEQTRATRLTPTPFEAQEIFDDYCVFKTTVQVPSFQAGELPFADAGGGWAFDAAGQAVQQRLELARVFVTVPRVAMPAAGYPAIMMLRTGAGGDRAIADRGVRNASGETIVPGSGPGREFARAGWVGVSMDGVHGGARNVTGADEQFMVFNLLNGEAMRDNLRQSALEQGWLARSLPEWSLDTSSCPGAAAVTRFDTSNLALYGHSMGSSIAPLALFAEPAFKAVILSGAGASWIENIVYKKKPLDTRPLAELLIGYSSLSRTLTIFDPPLTVVAWAIEPSDAQVYGPALAAEGPHTLMFQGIFDNYIRPRIANALTVALDLDVAGPVLDDGAGVEADVVPVLSRLNVLGGGDLPYPVSGNRPGRTHVVVQHPGDGLEDAHEVAFQTEPPKIQYRCFLKTLAHGLPVVIDPTAACPH